MALQERRLEEVRSRFCAPRSEEVMQATEAAKAQNIEEDPESIEETLAELRSQYCPPHADELMTTVSQIARGSGVEVNNMAVGEAEARNFPDEAKYETLTMTVNFEGESARIFRFLARLNQQLPSAEVSDIQIGNLDFEELTPAGVASLLFYLSPGPPEEEVP